MSRKVSDNQLNYMTLLIQLLDVSYHFYGFVLVVLQHRQENEILAELRARLTSKLFRSEVLLYLDHVARAVVEYGERILPEGKA